MLPALSRFTAYYFFKQHRLFVQAKVQDIVHSFQARFMADPGATSTGNNEGPARLEHESYRVIADPDNRNTLMDADLMPALLSGPSGDSYSVGVVSHIEVNRKGGAFSCPVRSGAVLSCVCMGCERPQPPAPGTSSAEPCSVETPWFRGPGKQWFRGMEALGSGSMTVVLRNCLNFTALQQHIADGDLPPQICVHVHRGRSHFQGVTVEFQTPAHGTPQVRPLLVVSLPDPEFSVGMLCP